MRTIHQWTSDEEQVVMKCIQENPGNILASLRKAAEELDVTFSVVKYRYYTHITKNNHCFLTISDKAIIKNRKAIKNNTNKFIVNKPKSTIGKWFNKLSKIFK